MAPLNPVVLTLVGVAALFVVLADWLNMSNSRRASAILLLLSAIGIVEGYRRHHVAWMLLGLVTAVMGAAIYARKRNGTCVVRRIVDNGAFRIPSAALLRAGESGEEGMISEVGARRREATEPHDDQLLRGEDVQALLARPGRHDQVHRRVGRDLRHVARAVGWQLIGRRPVRSFIGLVEPPAEPCARETPANDTSGTRRPALPTAAGRCSMTHPAGSAARSGPIPGR